MRDIEEIGGGGLAPEALGIALAGDGGGEEFVEAGDAREGFGVVANVSVERPGEVIAAFVVVGGVEREKSLGIADGSGTENEAGDHGESGGVGADAESEREDGNSGEGGRLGQSAERQTQVPGEVLQKVPNPYCADLQKTGVRRPMLVRPYACARGSGINLLFARALRPQSALRWIALPPSLP